MDTEPEPMDIDDEYILIDAEPMDIDAEPTEPGPLETRAALPTPAELRRDGRRMSLADLCQRLPPPSPAVPGYARGFRYPATGDSLHPKPRHKDVSSDIPPAPAPTQRATTPLPLSSYPPIVDLVAEHADLATTLTLRLVCRALKAQADHLLEVSTHGPEPGTPRGRFLVPRLVGHSRALLPPDTVVDHIYLEPRGMQSQLWLPPRTRRHVVVLSFDERTPPLCPLSVRSEIQTRGHILRAAYSRSAGMPVYPDLLDLVLVTCPSEDSTPTSDSNLCLPEPGDDSSYSEESDASDTVRNRRRARADARERRRAMRQQNTRLIGRPPPPGFFGHVVHVLAVADHLRRGSVRIHGLDSLRPGLVSKDLDPSASGHSVAAAALAIVEREVRANASGFGGFGTLSSNQQLLERAEQLSDRSRRELISKHWSQDPPNRWPKDASECLERLSVWKQEL